MAGLVIIFSKIGRPFMKIEILLYNQANFAYMAAPLLYTADDEVIDPQILSVSTGYGGFQHTTSQDNRMNSNGSINIERPHDADGQICSKSAYRDGEDCSDEGTFDSPIRQGPLYPPIPQDYTLTWDSSDPRDNQPPPPEVSSCHSNTPNPLLQRFVLSVLLT